MKKKVMLFLSVLFLLFGLSFCVLSSFVPLTIIPISGDLASLAGLLFLFISLWLLFRADRVNNN